MHHLIALCSGLVFALGLGLAGMLRPSKVIAFLDLTGDWDPSLAFVMAGAIAVYAPINRVMRARGRSLRGDPLVPPASTTLDSRLMLGAALFGAGWGLSGFCPGPALVSLSTLAEPALVFGAAMLTGMIVHAWARRRSTAS